MLRKFLMQVVLILFLLPNLASAEDVIIFHTNDTHGRILNTDDNGKTIGLAEISAAVKFTKSQNKNTFWLDAGDTLHGMPRINISNGENMIPLLNQAGVDVFVPGNHDFNYGTDQLEKIAKKFKFAVLAANVVKKSNGELLLSPYQIFQRGNIKIGVFGLATPETAYKAAPDRVEKVKFENPVETAQEMIKILRPQCDILVAVMHMGLDKSSEFTSERIAAETEGIDLIVDGHSHTELPEGLTVGETLIVQAGSWEHYLGKVTISVEDGKIISKKAELLDDAAVKKISPNPNKKISNSIAKIEKRNEKLFNQVLVHSDKKLSSDREIIRRSEAEIGNLCVDMIRWKTGADIAVNNNGSIRADLPAGNVTYGDIFAMLPFENRVRKAEVDGKTIRAMLEHSVFGYPATFGGFLSVSGMSFSFDPEKPEGQRVQDIFVGGEPLDENKIYTMAAPDFIFMGGDNYEMLKNSKVIGDFGGTRDCLIEYLNKVGLGDISLGRIQMLKVVEQAKAA